MGIDLRKDKDEDYCFILNNNVEILFTSNVKFYFHNKWNTGLTKDTIPQYFEEFSAIGIFNDDVLETFIPKESILMFTKVVKYDDDYGDMEQ